MDDSSDPRTSNLTLQRLGTAFVVVLVPVLLLALALPPNAKGPGAKKQDWVLGISLALAAASAAAYFLPNRLFARRSLLPVVLGGTALLVAGNVIWNDAYIDYVTAARKAGRTEVLREVFRRPMHNLHAPVYGRYDNAIARLDEKTGAYSHVTLPAVLLSAGIAAAWYAWAVRRPMERRWDARSFAVLLSFQLALIIAFALCEPPVRQGLAPQRLTNNISGYSAFRLDLKAFKGVGDTLRNYVYRMPTLDWYGQHYPPANLLLLTVEQPVGIPGLTKAIVCLLTVLSAVPLYLLARELGLDEAAASAAILLFAASTGVLVYCTINTTSLLLFPGTVCLLTLVRGLKTGSAGDAIVLGVAFACYLFFSFSASILGVLMALTTALAWWRGAATLRNTFRTGLFSLTAAVVAINVLYLLTRFDLIACFIVAVRGHQDQQGNKGFDDATRYLLRSTGNVLAYLLSIAPLFMLAIAAVWGRRRERIPSAALEQSLVIATLLTVLLAGFSGLFYIETERIWIFLTPFFALAAGAELARRSGSDRWLVRVVLLLVLLISCSQEFFFQHYR